VVQVVFLHIIAALFEDGVGIVREEYLAVVRLGKRHPGNADASSQLEDALALAKGE
jgi:hypothetical protein